MRALWFVALFVVSSASYSGGQQSNSSTPPPVPDAQPARVKVFAVGPGVTAPELLALGPPPAYAGKCKKKMNGAAVLSVLVDATGRPRNIMFLRPLGNDLDKFALLIADADRFKPGTHDGVPVVVGQSMEVNMQACVEQLKNDAGKKIYVLRLRSSPVQTLGSLPQPAEDAAYASSESNGKDPGSTNVLVYRAGSKITPPGVLYYPRWSSAMRRDAQNTRAPASSL